MKSFREAHPDLGCVNAPDDVQRYVDGRLHELLVAAAVDMAFVVVTAAFVVVVVEPPPPVQGMH